MAITPRPAIFDTPTSQAGSLSLNGARCRSSSSEVRFGQIIVNSKHLKTSYKSKRSQERHQTKIKKESNKMLFIYALFSTFCSVRIRKLFRYQKKFKFSILFSIFDHLARISRLPFTNCRRFPALHDFYVKSRKMFRAKTRKFVRQFGLCAASHSAIDRAETTQLSTGHDVQWILVVMIMIMMMMT